MHQNCKPVGEMLPWKTTWFHIHIFKALLLFLFLYFYPLRLATLETYAFYIIAVTFEKSQIIDTWIKHI